MKIYNALTGQKEEFTHLGGEVRMYVCGVTPYDECHLGHAMSYIIFDVVRRYLEFRGYRVKHVQNFTDIDDKIIARANLLGISPQELAERHIQGYFEDMEALNVRRAHLYPRATQEIPEMVALIGGLVEKGYAYQSGGDVYFRVNRVADYGKLSRRNLEGMMPGARIEPEAGKEHPMDFILWKAAKPGEPQWQSPWGPGRPGWHIECSAMSLKYLGESLDIHGGGQDLIFPHHENEIAQSEAFTGAKPFVRFWMHNGLMRLGEEKMSKSLGNLITLREALRRYSPDAIRLFVLGSYYRGPLTYSEEALDAMERGAERLRLAVRQGSTTTGLSIDMEPYRQQFLEAMEDDFDTPRAIATLFDLAREINRGREQGMVLASAQGVLRELAGLLGLTLEEPVLLDSVKPFVELLVSLRGELREAKQWALADKIRSGLRELGILLEDTAQGTLWRYQKGGGAP